MAFMERRRNEMLEQEAYAFERELGFPLIRDGKIKLITNPERLTEEDIRKELEKIDWAELRPMNNLESGGFRLLDHLTIYQKTTVIHTYIQLDPSRALKNVKSPTKLIMGSGTYVRPTPEPWGLIAEQHEAQGFKVKRYEDPKPHQTYREHSADGITVSSWSPSERKTPKEEEMEFDRRWLQIFQRILSLDEKEPVFLDTKKHLSQELKKRRTKSQYYPIKLVNPCELQEDPNKKRWIDRGREIERAFLELQQPDFSRRSTINPENIFEIVYKALQTINAGTRTLERDLLKHLGEEELSPISIGTFGLTPGRNIYSLLERIKEYLETTD